MTAHRISLILTDAQYEALNAAIRLTETTFEMDGPASVGMSPHTPRSLRTASERLNAAWKHHSRGAHRHE